MITRPGWQAFGAVGIAVRRDDRDRGIDPGLFTTDAEALVNREDVDLVIELIGGR